MLHARFNIPAQKQSFGQLSALFKYEFDQDQFEYSFTAWETLISQYQTTSGKLIGDDIKISVLKDRLPPVLQEYVTLHVDSTAKYTELRESVLNYYRSKKAYVLPAL